MEFPSIVNGWAFATPAELVKRIQLAEKYAESRPLSERQQRVLEEMKQAAARNGAA